MVDKIGVDRKWIQGHPELSFGKHRDASWVHFDIALSKKKLAIENGAILTDKFGPLEFTTKKWLDHSDQRMRDIAKQRLDMIEKLRERRRQNDSADIS